jgi:hypothetical protein
VERIEPRNAGAHDAIHTFAQRARGGAFSAERLSGPDLRASDLGKSSEEIRVAQTA